MGRAGFVVAGSGPAAVGASVPVFVEQRFPCMGSEAHVMVTGVDDRSVEGLLEWARARLDRLERSWSRFLDDSELSIVNAAPGRWHPVSPETLDLVACGLVARCATGGRFDPTLLDDVLAAGYTTSLTPLDIGAPAIGSGRRGSPVAHSRGPDAGCGDVAGAGDPDAQVADVEVDRGAGRMRVRPGVGFDPGGIGKGFAADLVVAELLGAGAGGACVNIGGDLRASGVAPSAAGATSSGALEVADDVDGSWMVEVEDPRDPSGPPLRRISLRDGAVATSSRCRRRWRTGDGGEAHHLIDPSTGRPSTADVLTATVVASEGWIAEALATAAFLAGPSRAADVVARHGATGVVVTGAGVVDLPGFGRFDASVHPHADESPGTGRTRALW